MRKCRLETVFADVNLHHVCQHAGDHDGGKTLHGEAAENDLAGEHDPGQRRVKRSADARGRPGGNEHFDVAGGQPENLSENAAQRRANLDNRTFTSDGSSRPDADATGKDLHQRYAWSDNPVMPSNGSDHFRHAVTLSLRSESPSEPGDQQ